MSKMLLALLACTFLSGCTGGATMVKGKVIRGDLSFILAVDEADPRLSTAGLPDAKVAIYRGVEQGGSLIAEEETNEKGDFSIPVKDSKTLLRQAGFSASKEGFAPASSTMSIPPVSQRVLVIMKPSSGTR